MILKNSKGNKIIMYIAIAVVVLLVAFLILRKNPAPKGAFENVNVEKVNEWIGNSEYQLVDVREPNEFSSGHIKSSVNIPLGSISSNMNKLDKDKKIVFICRSGNRSSQAAKLVSAEEGYQVYNMQGGMLAWKFEVE